MYVLKFTIVTTNTNGTHGECVCVVCVSRLRHVQAHAIHHLFSLLEERINVRATNPFSHTRIMRASFLLSLAAATYFNYSIMRYIILIFI